MLTGHTCPLDEHWNNEEITIQCNLNLKPDPVTFVRPLITCKWQPLVSQQRNEHIRTGNSSTNKTGKIHARSYRCHIHEYLIRAEPIDEMIV